MWNVPSAKESHAAINRLFTSMPFSSLTHFDIIAAGDSDETALIKVECNLQKLSQLLVTVSKDNRELQKQFENYDDMFMMLGKVFAEIQRKAKNQ